MPKFRVTSPDGRTFDVDAPEGATQDDAIAYVQKNHLGQQTTTAAPENPFLDRASDYIDGLKGQIDQGFTFGLADEVKAAGGAVGDYLGSKINPKFKYTGLGDAYDSNLARVRGQEKAFSEENPVSAGAANIVGGLANPLSKLMPTPAASMAGRAGQGAAMGAGYGGVYGFNSGEGGFEERLGSGAKGAAIGTALGGAASPLVEGTAATYRSIAQPILDRLGPANGASRRVVSALKRDGMTPDQLAARLDELGPEASIADAGGANLRGLGEITAQTPGKGAQAAESLLQGRMEGQGQRLSEGVNAGLSGRNIISSADDLMRERSALARPLYEQSVAEGNLIPDQAFLAVKNDPFLADVIASVKADKLSGMAGHADNAMTVVDAAKKNIDDMIEVAKRQGENNRVRMLVEKRDQLVSIADQAFPDYAAARAAWGGPTQSMAAMDAGREFSKLDPRVLQQQVSAMSDGEREFFRAGVADKIKEMIATTRDGADATRRIFGNDRIRQQLQAVFPDDASYNAFAKQVETEALFAKNRNQMLGNSRTSFRDAAREDLGFDPGGAVAHGMMGNFASAIGDAVRGGLRYLRRPPQGVMDQLADALFTPGGQSGNAQYLAALTKQGDAMQLSEQALNALARVLAQGSTTEAGMTSGRR